MVELAFEMDIEDVEEFREEVDVVEEVRDVVLFNGFFASGQCLGMEILLAA